MPMRPRGRNCTRCSAVQRQRQKKQCCVRYLVAAAVMATRKTSCVGVLGARRRQQVVVRIRHLAAHSAERPAAGDFTNKLRGGGSKRSIVFRTQRRRQQKKYYISARRRDATLGGGRSKLSCSAFSGDRRSHRVHGSSRKDARNYYFSCVAGGSIGRRECQIKRAV